MNLKLKLNQYSIKLGQVRLKLCTVLFLTFKVVGGAASMIKHLSRVKHKYWAVLFHVSLPPFSCIPVIIIIAGLKLSCTVHGIVFCIIANKTFDLLLPFSTFLSMMGCFL